MLMFSSSNVFCFINYKFLISGDILEYKDTSESLFKIESDEFLTSKDLSVYVT